VKALQTARGIAGLGKAKMAGQERQKLEKGDGEADERRGPNDARADDEPRRC